jgi:hypothetical protein
MFRILVASETVKLNVKVQSDTFIRQTAGIVVPGDFPHES